MYKNKRFLAIIPARSGSKGLSDKNIMPFGGIPLLAHTIKAATESQIFDFVLCSTDSEKYAEIAVSFGAKAPFLRPDSISGDKAGSDEFIVHTINELHKLGEHFDYFVLLQPTSPFRDANDIINAVNLLIDKQAAAIISVTEFCHNILTINSLPDNLSMNRFIDKSAVRRRQDAPKSYQINGAIYISEVSEFLKTKDFYSEKSFAYIMEKIKSVDIDDIIDFKAAEALLDYISK